MAQYRKKPVVIEAVLWEGNDESYRAVCQFMGQFLPYSDETGELTISTLAGDMLAATGDYIIRGVKGEYYPCTPDIFKLTYDPV